MSTYGWSTFIGENIGGRYVLQTLVRAESRTAVFKATATTDQYSGEALLSAVRGSRDECDHYLRRFLEAKFLKHPNLMDVLDAGEVEVQGTHLAFVVTEPAGTSLQQEETLDRDSTWRLASDVVAGLAYLHSENLVYCALRPETIWRVGRTWKLGDYHELRLSGNGRTAETRAMMGRMPEVPPEAFEGVVSPAWDVWALGVTLARVLRRDSRERRLGPLPAEFEAIVNSCLDPDPAARITSAALAERLATGYHEAHSPDPGTAEAPDGAHQPFADRSPQRPAFLAAVAGVAGTLREKSRSLFHREEKPGTSERDGRRRSSKWILFPIAGALVGASLTLVALKREGPGPESNSKSSAPTSTNAPPSAAPSPPPRNETKPNPENPLDVREADRTKAPSTNGSIEALLDRWVQSTRKRNVEEQIACYTPVVDAFYGRRQLSTNELRTEKVRQFSSISSIRKFQISNVRISRRGPNNALVSFKKEWDFETFAGSEQDELALRLMNGEWKIASERGRKLYWVRRNRRESQKASAEDIVASR
jgi:serine/threonine protein kinase